MQNRESFSSGEKNSEAAGDNPWADMAETAPAFNSEQRESEESDKTEISEKDVAMKMLDVSDERQGEYVDWLNQINQRGGNLYGDAAAEYDAYLHEQNLADNPESLTQWQKELESLLEEREQQDRLIIEALGDLDKPENANKTFTELLTSRAEQSQKAIEASANAGNWDNLTDEQREAYVRRRNGYQNLADWSQYVRESLQADEDVDDVAKSGENLGDSIDIDAKIEDLQEEIQKREASINYYKAQNQRDYGGDVITFTARLHEKQADLHVLKMIRLDNSDKSEDEMIPLENATTTVEKYISDREGYFDKLTEQRSHYTKGSAEYLDLTKKRGRWYREIEAARRVAKQLGLSLAKTVEVEDADDTRE